MVSSTERLEHRRFHELSDVLYPGDLLVVNVSATAPAAVDLANDQVIHFSTRQPGDFDVVEVRRRVGFGTVRSPGVGPGEVELPGGSSVELLTPFPLGSTTRRLWLARSHLSRSLPRYLARYGQPITYAHTNGTFPLDDYQTVFAMKPGSAEMPSAGRPFSTGLVTRLAAMGVRIAPLTLHTGVSSLEDGEPPFAEWFDLPLHSADLVNHTRTGGGRVIAVGTTVVRALETTVDDLGKSHPGRGWTDLVIGEKHEMRAVDGLITGWHEPSSTHLDMLIALAGRSLIETSYDSALDRGYLWHEFGDSHLIIGRPRVNPLETG
jgi:S-adenosylmethionine:tRNA ribosyltransferase-isomerase